MNLSREAFHQFKILELVHLKALACSLPFVDFVSHRAEVSDQVQIVFDGIVPTTLSTCNLQSRVTSKFSKSQSFTKLADLKFQRFVSAFKLHPIHHLRASPFQQDVSKTSASQLATCFGMCYCSSYHQRHQILRQFGESVLYQRFV